MGFRTEQEDEQKRAVGTSSSFPCQISYLPFAALITDSLIFSLHGILLETDSNWRLSSAISYARSILKKKKKAFILLFRIIGNLM